MQEEYVIYPKDLIFAACYRYKRILAVALVFALLLGGVAALQGWKQSGDAEQAYAQAMQVYTADKEILEDRLEALELQIQQQKQYMDESVFQQLQVYDYYVAELNLFVEALSQTQDKTDDVLTAYKARFMAQETMQMLATVLSTKPEYVAELLSVEKTANGSLALRVLCPDEQTANTVKQQLLQSVTVLQTQVNETVCSHRSSIVTLSVRRGMDTAVVEQQNAASERLRVLSEAAADVQNQINDLVMPTAVAAQRTQMIKKTVIFAVAGMALGAFLTVALIWLMHAAGTKIYSARTLTVRTGIKVIGRLNDRPMKKGVINSLRRMEGRQMVEPSAQVCVLAVNIANCLDGKKQLLLTGTASCLQRQQLLQALQAELPQVQVVDAGCILDSAQSMHALSASDAVVLVEQCYQSRYHDALAQAAIVKDCGKALIGCVLLGG